jgi:hypothetical protein
MGGATDTHVCRREQRIIIYPPKLTVALHRAVNTIYQWRTRAMADVGRGIALHLRIAKSIR